MRKWISGLVLAAALAAGPLLPSHPSEAAGFGTSSNGCEWIGEFYYTGGSSARAYTYGDLTCTQKAVLWDVQWTWNSNYYSSGWMEVSGFYIPYNIGQADDGNSYHQIKPNCCGYGQVVGTYLS